MNFEKLSSIQLSLLLKKSEINDENKAAYSKKITAKFTFPPEFSKTEENIALLLDEMFKDLLRNAPDDIDALGIWIEYDTITMENAIQLRTLDDIVMYSTEKINPTWELFKMTIQENGCDGPNDPQPEDVPR